MTKEKFISDSEVLLKFIQLYCKKKHHDHEKHNESIHLVYQGEDLKKELHYKLCDDCKETFYYSMARLKECPHEEKPSCRKCPKPCYGKDEWKKLAKIMKFSGMHLGLTKIKKMFIK